MEFWAEDEIRTRDPNLGKVMLYQLSYFRVLRALLGCKNNNKILIKKDFLLVFWRVLCTFWYFHFWLSLIFHAIQSITSTKNKGQKGKKLYMKKKTWWRNPVSSEIFFSSVISCIVLHIYCLRCKNKEKRIDFQLLLGIISENLFFPLTKCCQTTLPL